MSKTLPVGMSQRVQLPWLEYAAELVRAGHDRREIQRALLDLLRDKLSVGGTAERGTREKAVSILMKVWVTVPKDLQGLRDDGLCFHASVPPSERLAVHWGMTIAAYPFWGIVAEATGRLLRLQGEVGAAEVQRRVRERLGERETVARAARRALRAFLDWGVLKESGRKGTYLPLPPIRVRDPALSSWLLESLLRASGQESLAVDALRTHPALFPLAIEVPESRLARQATPRMEVARQGLDRLVAHLAACPSSR